MEEPGKELKIIQINILQTSMTLGTYLGAYITLVYALMALSIKYAAISLITIPLTLGIPVIAFFLIKRFRDTNCKPFFPFPVSWMISILTFLFATMLSCMAAYLYLRFLDNGAFAAGIMERMNELLLAQESLTSTMSDPAQIQEYNTTMDLFKQTITWFCSLSPSAVTKYIIQSSLMWGNILSLIIAIITAKSIKINR